MDPNIFIPGRGQSPAPAKAICATCPEREPCLNYALSLRTVRGVWGGASDRERRLLRRSLMTDLSSPANGVTSTNGHTAAPGDTPCPSSAGPDVRLCEGGCGTPLTERQLRSGGRYCSVPCSARKNGTAAAAKAKATHSRPATPTPMAVPLAGPAAAPNPSVVLAAWGAMLGGLDQAGIRLDGYSIAVTPDSWSLQLHPSVLTERNLR